MVRPLLPTLAAALLLLGSACNCGDKDDASSDATDKSSEAAGFSANGPVLDAMKALGDEGTAVVVLWPEHWSEVHEVLAPWLSRLPPEAAVLSGARDVKALPGLLGMPLGISISPSDLSGWDLERPLVASLGEVPYEGPPGAITPQLPMLEGWMPPMRHQIVVPASDAAGLVAALAGAVEPTGKPWPALVEGRKGGRGVDLEEGAVALLPEDDVVRVVIFQGGQQMKPEARLEHMRQRLEVEKARLDETPALSLVARDDAALSAWVRPWRMRALAAWEGGYHVVGALRYVSADNRQTMIARASQIVLDSELVMSDAGAETDDMALALLADDGALRLRAALSLTPEGQEIMEEAEDDAADAFEVKVDDAWIDAVVRLDLRAALDAAQPPPAFDEVTRAGMVAEKIYEGGALTMMYMALRHPVGLFRKFEALGPGELPLPLTSMPTAVHLVWRGMDGELPRGAMAVQWPKGYSTTALDTLVAIASTDRDFATLRTDKAERDGAPVSLFGMGDDPRTVFDPTEDGDVDALVQVELSLDRMGAFMSMVEPELGRLLMGEALMTWEHRGRALVGELVWVPSGKEVKAERVPVARRASWDSPLGPSADAKGVACLSKAGLSLAEGLRALSTIAPDQTGLVGTKVLAEAEEPLRCALDDDATAAAAARLRRMAVETIVGAQFEGNQEEEALGLLKTQCEASKDEQLCALLKAKEALPKPSLATLETDYDCEVYSGGELDLRVDASSVSVDGEAVSLADLPARVKAKVDDYGRDASLAELEIGGPPSGPSKPTTSIVVDESLPMSQVRPVLQALVDAGLESVVIVGRDRGGSKAQAVADLTATLPTNIPPPPSAAPPPPPAAGGAPSVGIGSLLAPPPEEDVYGLFGTTPTGMAPAQWALFRLAKDGLTARSWLREEESRHGTFSASTLRDSEDGAWRVYVQGEDDAPWKDVALALAVGCPSATLVISTASP